MFFVNDARFPFTILACLPRSFASVKFETCWDRVPLFAYAVRIASMILRTARFLCVIYCTVRRIRWIHTKAYQDPFFSSKYITVIRTFWWRIVYLNPRLRYWLRTTCLVLESSQSRKSILAQVLWSACKTTPVTQCVLRILCAVLHSGFQVEQLRESYGVVRRESGTTATTIR